MLSGPSGSVPTARSRAAMPAPRLDPESALLFVINAAAGALDVDAKRAVIESTLAARGRRGELLVCAPDELACVATEAAGGGAGARHGGGGGRRRRQPRHGGAGGARGGLPDGGHPYGTFNYFARTHGIPTEPAAAVRHVLDARPRPVQVGAINDRVFLVNASLGVYPELLQDREAYKARFGRSRWVAFVAGCATLLRAQRRLRLHIETGCDGPRRADPDPLRGQQPAAVAAARCGARKTPCRHARRWQPGRADAAAHRHAVDARADAARGDGQAGRSRRRGELRVHRTWW